MNKNLPLSDIVILDLGFTGPEEALPNLLDIDMDNRGNISSNSDYQTKKNNIFIYRGRIIWLNIY
mgnify:CR=1 FL=1